MSSWGYIKSNQITMAFLIRVLLIESVEYHTFNTLQFFFLVKYKTIAFFLLCGMEFFVSATNFVYNFTISKRELSCSINHDKWISTCITFCNWRSFNVVGLSSIYFDGYITLIANQINAINDKKKTIDFEIINLWN